MKKFLFLLFIVVSKLSMAQLIHVEGNKGVGFNYYYTPPGSAYELAFYKFLNDRSYIKTGLNYESGLYTPLTDYANLSLEVAYSRCLTLKKSFIYFNPLGGLSLNIETYQNPEFSTSYSDVNKKLFYSSGSNFSYSVFVGGEVEFFFYKSLAVTLTAKQYYTLKSKFGDFRFQAGPGLKVLF